MIRARLGWLALAAAAALPLAGAEPAEEMRAKTRDLYMKYAQAPATQESPSLKAAAEDLLVLPVRRPETRPISPAPTTAPATRPQEPTPPPAPAVALPHEVDPVALKALASAQGIDVSLLAATADGLFTEGRLTSAAAIYEIITNQPCEGETLAWARYQLGNCRRKQAPESAVKLYDKVRQEAADCPWRDAAEASFRVLEWMQTQQLSALLEADRPAAGEPAKPTPASAPAPAKE
ncbi:MAG: hypothetical protein NTV86_20280 [Planctomycetota bacterium]|nr:hypothetical protein [Planctomycetota bacterium]